MLRNLVIRNLEDRSYFIEPVKTNGEASSNEDCETEEKILAGEDKKVEDSQTVNGRTENTDEPTKEKFFDKQRIEKIVNG